MLQTVRFTRAFRHIYVAIGTPKNQTRETQRIRPGKPNRSIHVEPNESQEAKPKHFDEPMRNPKTEFN